MCSLTFFKDQWFQSNRTNEFLNRTNKLQATLTKYKTNERFSTIRLRNGEEPIGFLNSKQTRNESNENN